MKIRLILGTSLAVIGLLAFSTSSIAQMTIVWSGAGDGSTFEDPANWVGGVVPGGMDTADIGTATVDINGGIPNNVSIIGSGGTTFDSGGVIEFQSNDNTFSGGTLVTNGTEIRLNAGGGTDHLGTGDITLDDGAYLKNRNTNVTIGNNIIVGAGGGGIEVGWNNRNITVNGDISGTGELAIRDDSSRVQLSSATNSYTGGTEIIGTAWTMTDTLGTGDVTLNNVNGSRGHLKNWLGFAEHDNDIIVDNTNGGRLSAGWNNDLQLHGVVSGAGTLQIEGDSGTVVLDNAANTFTGNIDLLGVNVGGDPAPSRITFNSLGSGSFAGVISGTNASDVVTYAGSGPQVLIGNSTYAGETIVSAGELYIDGNNGTATGDVDVLAGATLGGSGTIGGATDIFGDVNAGNNSEDTLTFLAATTLDAAATSTFEFGALSAGNFDVLANDGDLFTAGGTLNLADSGYYAGAAVNDTFLILDGWSGFAGSFSTINGTDLGNNLVFDTSNLLVDGTVTVVSAVPEPSTLGLMALGLMGVGLRRRKRR